jgi:hypothetical protein
MIEGDHNNKMECLNGSIRDREDHEKNRRWIPYPEGQPNLPQLHPRASRPNGNTPAEKYGTIIEGDNKWKTLIENASNSLIYLYKNYLDYNMLMKCLIKPKNKNHLKVLML